MGIDLQNNPIGHSPCMFFGIWILNQYDRGKIFPW